MYFPTIQLQLIAPASRHERHSFGIKLDDLGVERTIPASAPTHCQHRLLPLLRLAVLLSDELFHDPIYQIVFKRTFGGVDSIRGFIDEVAALWRGEPFASLHRLCAEWGYFCRRFKSLHT
jgi:hypothetical protein